MFRDWKIPARPPAADDHDALVNKDTRLPAHFVQTHRSNPYPSIQDCDRFLLGMGQGVNLESSFLQAMLLQNPWTRNLASGQAKQNGK